MIQSVRCRNQKGDRNVSKKKENRKKLIMRVLAGLLVFGMVAVIILSALWGQG